MTRTPTTAFILGSLIASACTAPGLDIDTGRVDPSSPDGIPDGPATCPADPDCYIGGSCEVDECPEYWACLVKDGVEICQNPGPEYPDGGHWDCEDIGGVTRCRRDGPVPDDGGDGSFVCRDDLGVAVCDKTQPDYPDDDGGWSCSFVGGRRVCERDYPDMPGDACFDTKCDSPGDGGGDDGSGDGGDGGDTPDDGNAECNGALCVPDECTAPLRSVLTLLDDRDGADDGQIYALGDGRRDRACATVRVDVTGYYQLFDEHIAESCSTQLDETGYLTVGNACNVAGTPLESNAGAQYVVPDVDNTASCTADADCPGGSVCREGNRGSCCVPAEPVFMGTFLLRAGEDNVLCLNHLCPLWRNTGTGDGFINAGCVGSPNSIHLELDASLTACASEHAIPETCR